MVLIIGVIGIGLAMIFSLLSWTTKKVTTKMTSLALGDTSNASMCTPQENIEQQPPHEERAQLFISCSGFRK